MYFCVSAKTGETVEKQRVSGIKSGGRPVYASPVSIDGKLFMSSSDPNQVLNKGRGNKCDVGYDHHEAKRNHP